MRRAGGVWACGLLGVLSGLLAGCGGPTPPARPVLPEIAQLDPGLVQCFYGADEAESACRAPEFDRAERIETAGGHHFDGDYAALAERIMAGARRRALPG